MIPALRPSLPAAALAVGLVAGPRPSAAAEGGDAEEDPWDPWSHAEVCVQTPEQSGKTLGHVRLVIEDRWFERRTMNGEAQIPSLDPDGQEQRNRKSRRLMAVLPPMLRFPIAARPTWGRRIRGERPDRQRHPDGSEFWPFDCWAVPLDQAQTADLWARANAPFADGVDEVVNHDFRYLRDNCTTWVCELLAQTYAERPGPVPEGVDLAALLVRRLDTPAKLRRALESWRAEEPP